jgi:serine phosphatase RsbU (regulator of sigma subunit)
MDRPFERTLRLPEVQALVEHADSGNAVVLWRLATVAGVVSVGAGLMFFALGKPWPMAFALTNAALLAVLYLKSESLFVVEHNRALCFGLLLVELALAVFGPWGLTVPMKVGLAGVVFPLLTLFFHFRPLEHLVLLLPMWGTTVWLWSMELSGLWTAPRQLGGFLWPSLATLAFAAAAQQLDERRRQAFVADWRREVSLDRERTRMKEEIEDARQVQISMLPKSTPQLSWLEIAGVSLPASEVGGDYFDYFPLPNESLAIVVGDVAGHGLSSGLLLAALRSCLYLLRNDLSTPIGVLEKLDDMVRHTTDRRLLATLQCAHFDRAARQVTVANAGHPAALHYQAASGLLGELALPGLPLGTRLRGTFQEISAPLGAGDLLLLYSDGLIEMSSPSGEAYGDGRLQRVLGEAARTRKPVREIRNTVMADLANFKGDARRADDVTLVVVRVR